MTWRGGASTLDGVSLRKAGSHRRKSVRTGLRQRVRTFPRGINLPAIPAVATARRVLRPYPLPSGPMGWFQPRRLHY